MAVSLKGTLNAYRNLTNRLEEAVGDCTNIHIAYPALVYGFLHLIRANHEGPVPENGRKFLQADSCGNIKVEDIAVRASQEIGSGIRRYHDAISRLARRRDLRNDITRYEAWFLTQMCARFSPQQVSHAVERGCGCVRAHESAVKSSIAQSTAACAGPAFGGGPARRQPVPPQGAEALAFTGRRTMNTRGTRPGLSPTMPFVSTSWPFRRQVRFSA